MCISVWKKNSRARSNSKVVYANTWKLLLCGAGLWSVPSFFIPTAKHFWKRQKGQRFLCERFMGHLCCSEQVYFLLFWTERLKNPCKKKQQDWKSFMSLYFIPPPYYLFLWKLTATKLQGKQNKNKISKLDRLPCSFHRWAAHSDILRLCLRRQGSVPLSLMLLLDPYSTPELKNGTTIHIKASNPWCQMLPGWQKVT